MITGSIVALATPMNDVGEIEWEALRRLVDFHVEQGTEGIVAAGTTGEPSTMSFDEHVEVLRVIVDQVNGRIPVIAGTGANATWEAVKLTKCAQELGADYCLSVAPYYNRPTQEGMYQHFKAVAEVGLPTILYNVPKRTGVDIDNETVFRLAELDNIVGLKEATGDMARAAVLVEHFKGGNFALYSGDDPTACDFMTAGGQGVISVSANVIPRLMHEMCAAALQGNPERAREIDAQMAPVNDAMGVEPNPIPVKWALNYMGLAGKGIRLPLTRLSEQHHAVVAESLALAKVVN
ncbi:4-hydroxy-tetrahydrodipicolinate synthase [Carnimonas nigrificans]|uniref:4-hydroxy-tetrahydrodipicolinate synthase n=1 Tax=Carnimonas nigrificans TaxID=64323 RepID=UPI000470DFBD|nr:4-hydroxy-tetrahydrodipicolinate synthase [Carnimonas nigrificans]